MPPHVLGDGRLTHGDAQLLQLPVDPRRTPQRIRRGQLTDQGANVCWHARTPSALSTLPGPEQTKATPVPPDNGLWREDVHGRAPAAPSLREPRPEHAVGGREPKTWAADRLRTASWCRSAMTSRCSDARDRTTKRSEWSSETRTDVTTSRLSENARNLNCCNTCGLGRFTADHGFKLKHDSFLSSLACASERAYLRLASLS